jgi:hypothetical protein
MSLFTDKPFFLVDKKSNQVRLEVQKNPEIFLLSDKEKRKAYAYGKRYSMILISCGLYTYSNIRRNNELLSLKIRKFTPTQLVPIITYNAVIALVTYCLGHVFFYDRFKLFCHQLSLIEVQKYNSEKFNFNNYKYAILNPPVYSGPESNFGHVLFIRHFVNYSNELPGWIQRRRKGNKDIELDLPAQL